MKKIKGISLIVLVITIIVIIILAGAVILSLSNNNPIEKAEEAKFKTNIREYDSELSLLLTSEYINNNKFDSTEFNKDNSEIANYIMSIKEEDLEKFKINEGKLVYIGTDDNEAKWALESGILVEKHIYTNEEISNMINQEGYIPVASALELYNIRNMNDNVFGVGTEWEGTYTGGATQKYIQVNDIDLTSYLLWVPSCGISGPPFSGIYDGNNYTISNVVVSGNYNYASIFGLALGNSQFKNLIVKNAEITTTFSESWVGAGILVGVVPYGNVVFENIHVSGTVNGLISGGIIGVAQSSNLNINNCTAKVNVLGDTIGGLVGVNCANIQNSNAFGLISGNSYVGGLVGQNNGEILNSYANCNVECEESEDSNMGIGGFVGINNGLISNCYSISGIESLVGNTGGFAGINNGEILNCYYDKQLCGFSDSDKGLPRNTDDMIYTYNVENTYLEWDFDTVWIIDSLNNDGYPYFQ